MSSPRPTDPFRDHFPGAELEYFVVGKNHSIFYNKSQTCFSRNTRVPRTLLPHQATGPGQPAHAGQGHGLEHKDRVTQKWHRQSPPEPPLQPHIPRVLSRALCSPTAQHSPLLSLLPGYDLLMSSPTGPQSRKCFPGNFSGDT